MSPRNSNNLPSLSSTPVTTTGVVRRRLRNPPTPIGSPAQPTSSLLLEMKFRHKMMVMADIILGIWLSVFYIYIFLWLKQLVPVNEPNLAIAQAEFYVSIAITC